MSINQWVSPLIKRARILSDPINFLPDDVMYIFLFELYYVSYNDFLFTKSNLFIEVKFLLDSLY